MRNLFCVLALAGTFAFSDSLPPPAPADRAAKLLEALRRDTRTPGISAAVALRGRIVFSHGTGHVDLEHGTRASGRHVYNIGSVSKVITSVAVMQLVEKKRLTLDDDVRGYVPEFPDKGSRITIRHLLTHTSGIRHYWPNDFPGTPDNENILPVDGFRDGLRFFAADSLLFKPGAFRFYTSYGVNLLEGVIENVSGLPFETYLRNHVWKPAGMTATSFDRPDVIVEGRARSYRLDHGVWRNQFYNDLRYKFASGGMLSSAEDLVRFAAAVNARRLAGAETVDLLFREHAGNLLMFREEGRPEIPRHEQGLLWRLRTDARGRRVAFHCGSVKAFNACLVDFFEEDLVAAILTNSWECCGWSKADELAAIFRQDVR